MNGQNRLIGGMLLGAGLMYLLDPDRGARRRALVRDQAVRAGHKLGGGLEATTRDLRNRGTGAAAELRARLRREEVTDEVLEARVRSALGRATSHPGSITVTAEAGRVTLRGAVLAAEADEVIRCAERVRGVREVISELQAHQEAGDVPGLQGGRPREARPELAQENWAPGTRVLVSALGGVLTYQGLRTRGPMGWFLASSGVGLLARAGANLPAKRLVGVGAGRRAVDIQKIINVAVPIEEVWDFWSNFENFPRFMSHLKEVRRTGDGRSHWVAAGPAGVPVEWDAVVTEWIPQQVIAWKSAEGSTVGNAGLVRFRSNPDGTTQIDVKLSYNPPGGALGHAVASLFGADPKRAMDEDLVRLQSILEEGKTSADQGRVHREELPITPTGPNGSTG